MSKTELSGIGPHRVIDVASFSEIQRDLRELEASVALNGFQKWILKSMYDFNLPDAPFKIASLLLIAVPHPMYSDVTFEYDGKRHQCLSLVGPDFAEARKLVEAEASRVGFHHVDAPALPLKLLGVRSGLSEYGKNNVTYAGDFGSCFSYIAFLTDLEPLTTSLRPVLVSKTCDGCMICQRLCPTQAIRKESFIIDNERCLSCLNESGNPFPDWVPLSAHHTLYDCLVCQRNCPMNRARADDKGRDVSFTESETRKLIDKVPFLDLGEALRAKARYLGLDQWPDGISKNILALVRKDSIQ